MLIFDPAFPIGYQGNVQKAVQAIQGKINDPQLPLDLRAGLNAVVSGSSCQVFPYDTIVSRCAMIAYDDGTTGPFAYTGGACIWLCKKVFDTGQARVNAVLFHELVHVLCGWELDAEVFENLLFIGQGATIPEKGDVDAFAQTNWKGRWVRVDKNVMPPVVRDLWRDQSLNVDQSFFANF